MEFRIRDIVIGVEYCNILLVEGNRSAPPCTLTNNHNAQFFSQNDKKYTKVRPEKLKLSSPSPKSKVPKSSPKGLGLTQ